jgi:NTE family protein
VSNTVLRFRHLVFEGGGIKGAAYAKVPLALSEFGILQKITKIAGSSAGAIIATLITLQYSPEQIAELVEEMEFVDFKDYIPLYTIKVFNIVFKSGEYSGKQFETWIQDKIYYQTANKCTTLGELHEKSGIELVLTGTCLDTRTTEFLSYKTHPNMPVWMACRISMAIPGFFMPFRYEGKTYVDGGMLYNYPIWVFDNVQDYTFKMSNIDYANDKTLGFKLVSGKDCDFVSTIPKVVPILTTMLTIFNILLDHIDSSYIHKSYWDRTVGINTLDVKTTEFGISPSKKAQIIENGYNNTKKYIRNYIESRQ